MCRIEQTMRAAARFEKWWKGQNDTPLIFYQYPSRSFDQTPFHQPWMEPDMDASWVGTPLAFQLTREDGDRSRFDDLLAMVEPQADCLSFMGAGFPRYFPVLGPGCLAAFISGYSKLHNGTVWYELGGDVPPMPLEAVAELDPRTSNEYADLALDLAMRTDEVLGGKMLISMTDLGGNFDLLSALCGTTQLLMNLMDKEAQVHAALERLDEMWMLWYRRFDGIFAPASHGYRGCWMQIVSDSPFYCLQCDFGAMISPEMFRDFVRPSLVRIAGQLGRAVFHLDGPQMRAHLPHICDVPEIHAVQWTPGAGNPGVEDPAWFNMYREIIDRGCKLVLLCFPPEPDMVERLFAALPANEFYLHFEGPDRATGEKILMLT